MGGKIYKNFLRVNILSATHSSTRENHFNKQSRCLDLFQKVFTQRAAAGLGNFLMNFTNKMLQYVSKFWA